MKLYRFSPIQSKTELLEAITHVHFACHRLCKQSFGKYLANAKNMGVFCHYPAEYEFLIGLRNELTRPSNNPDQKYFELYQPIVIPKKANVPKTTYTHLYIRKPDPYRAHVGDIDFFVEPSEYDRLKQSLKTGTIIPGARILDRLDLDMIELYDPDIDALGYVSTKKMTTSVRAKINVPKKT